MTGGPKSSGDAASAAVLLGHPFDRRPPGCPSTDGYDIRDRQPGARFQISSRAPKWGKLLFKFALAVL